MDHRKRLIVICINSAMRCGEVNSGIRKQLTTPLNEALEALATATPSLNPVSERLRRLEALIGDTTLFDIAQITASQINELSSRLAVLKKDIGTDWHSYVRICLLHHHVFAVRAADNGD